MIWEKGEQVVFEEFELRDENVFEPGMVGAE